MSANTTYTYTVRLRVKAITSSSSDKIQNQATFRSGNSYDYFVMSNSSTSTNTYITGSYKKYITAITEDNMDSSGNVTTTTKTISGRNNYTNTYKKSNAVIALYGDIVTYTLEVTNTSETYMTISSLTITDTMESGLVTYGNSFVADGKTSFSYTFTNIAPGATATVTLKARVTKTGAYTGTIENKFVLSSGKGYNKTTTVVSYKVGDSSSTTKANLTYYQYSETNLNISSTYFTNAGNADYVKIATANIDKYITAIQYPSNYFYELDTSGDVLAEDLNYQSELSISGRSGKTNSVKSSDPVQATPFSYITYTIKVSIDKTGVYTISDTYDTSNCTYVSEGSSNWTVGSSGTLSIKTQLDADTEYTFTVKLLVKKEAVTATIITNTATFTVDNYYSVTSSDYFKITGTTTVTYEHVTGEYYKYISAVNGTAVSGRDSYSNYESSIDPVTVEQGDVVTFTLAVNNTSEYSQMVILSLLVEDTMQTGLERTSDGATSFQYTFSDIDGGSTATYSFDVTVTESNMYLFTLYNEFNLISGSSVGREVYDTYFDVEPGAATPDYEEVQDYIEDLDLDNMVEIGNRDYVQLDDVEIAGDIWIDDDQDGIKQGDEDPYSNVAVTLYRRPSTGGSWTAVSTVYPDSSGHYTFGKIEKGDTAYGLGTRKYSDSSGYYSYYVEFEYWGTYYEATTYTPAQDSSGYYVTDTGYSSSDWPNQSHASEELVSTNNRTDFNNKFETVAYNTAYEGTSSSDNQIDLDYTRSTSDTHVVELTEPTLSNLTSNADTIISARSFELYLYCETATGDIYTEKCDYVDYLQHINLGLFERDQADIEIEKDVYSAEMTINGKTTTYTYNGLESGTYSGSYEVDEAYELLIYNEDYVYRTVDGYGTTLAGLLGLDSSNDLQITLTYKITVTNTSSFVIIPREIIDISTSEMTLVEVYDEVSGSYTVRDESTYNTTSLYDYSDYTATFITGDGLEQVLNENDSVTFYITYSVEKDSGAIILDDGADDLGKVNIAQVGAFSAYNSYTSSTNKSVAGVVDKDSNPGDVNTDSGYDLTDSDYYEDDTYQTSIKLLLREDPDNPTDPNDPNDPTDPDDPDTPSGSYLYRKITGNVWEDIASDSDTVDLDGLTEYLGNGVKDGGEEGAENILVKLYEVQTDSSGNQYLIDSGIYTYTDENGDYVLEDEDLLHAGTYVVRFIYGYKAEDPNATDNDGLTTDNNGDTIAFSGQDYKSTTYTDVGDEDDEDEVVEGDAFSDVTTANGTLSFARDNELRRLEVINYSTTMTYELDSILKDSTSTDLVDNTSMFADTKKFNVQIEYIDYYADSNFTYEALKSSGTGFNTKMNVVSEVNFGLIERPLTILELADDITEVIAITSDGSELVHLYYDITYGISSDAHLTHTSTLKTDDSTGAGNVQSLNRSTSSQGFRYINVDTDILQGLTIIVKYQIAIANVSETDSSGSNLVEMVEEDELETTISSLTGNINSVSWSYGGGESTSGASSAVRVDYSYNKLLAAVGHLSDYTISGVDYYSGYFVGNTYYTGTDTKTVTTASGSTTIEDVAVETRVDQLVDYIDTDAEYVSADNVNSEGSNKFITYSIEEIATGGVNSTTLLAGISDLYNSAINSTSSEIVAKLNEIITDGTNAIVSYSDIDTIVKNNAVFNVESDEVNGALYKYMTPTNTEDDDISINSLYSITLQCSRTMTSEADAEGVSIENIAEIVKVSNTVGRKVYVTAGSNATNVTGHIGNSSETITELTSVGAVEVAAESDTDYTEQVTLSPPTGLTVLDITEQRIVNVVIIIVVVAAIAIVIVALIMVTKIRKKFYR